jgi:hypothetical protein
MQRRGLIFTKLHTKGSPKQALPKEEDTKDMASESDLRKSAINKISLFLSQTNVFSSIANVNIMISKGCTISNHPVEGSIMVSALRFNESFPFVGWCILRLDLHRGHPMGLLLLLSLGVDHTFSFVSFTFDMSCMF